jgi:hypothetical protein
MKKENSNNSKLIIIREQFKVPKKSSTNPMLEKFILGDDDKATNAEKDMEIQDILKLFPDKNITKK